MDRIEPVFSDSEACAITVGERADGFVCVLPDDPRFLVRLEGAILAGDQAMPGAAAFLRAAAGRYMLISHNSRDTARTMSVKLKRAGLDVPPECILLAGEEAVRHVGAAYPRARCIVLASRVLSHAARAVGLIHVQADAQVVLIGRDATWSYKRLALAANEVARGAVLVATNPEGAVRGEDGRLIPDTGSLLAAVEAVTGRKADCLIGGAGASLLLMAQARLGVEAGQLVLIEPARRGGTPLAALAGMGRLPVDPEGAAGGLRLEALAGLVALR